MTGVTADFFNSLPERASTALPPPSIGTLRIDLLTENGTERWYVTFGPGRAEVSRDGQTQDAILTMTAELFERTVTGRARLLAALMRNETTLAGSLLLLHALRHFLPMDPDTRDPREVARARATARRQQAAGHQDHSLEQRTTGRPGKPEPTG